VLPRLQRLLFELKLQSDLFDGLKEKVAWLLGKPCMAFCQQAIRYLGGQILGTIDILRDGSDGFQGLNLSVTKGKAGSYDVPVWLNMSAFGPQILGSS
jgi:hypothetical protein